MKVELLHYTPLFVADTAISKCYDTGCKFSTDEQQNRINRVANVSKHASTIEHLTYNFDIEGISRAVLQELSRHRIASYSVKSTRYTLKELKGERGLYDAEWGFSWGTVEKYCKTTGNYKVDVAIAEALVNLQSLVQDGIPNDVTKYTLPEAYKTALVMSINARALQNFLELRTSKHALWEIQELAREMYSVIPADHQFLFQGNVKN
jgi:thymidylate synthase (FAD)